MTGRNVIQKTSCTMCQHWKLMLKVMMRVKVNILLLNLSVYFVVKQIILVVKTVLFLIWVK